MDRGAWRGVVHGIPELDTTEATWHACMQDNSSLADLGQERTDCPLLVPIDW